MAEPLAGSSFLCPDAADSRCTVLHKSAAGLARWRGIPLDPELRQRFDIRAVLSVPIAAESLEGWLFFTDKRSMTSDDLVLGEIVAGVMAARLDHFYLNQRLQESVATEERIRLARDLHDGVLQSLTGIGLRLAAVRGLLDENPRRPGIAWRRLQGLIAREQRDLRFFIQELKPPPLGRHGRGVEPGRQRRRAGAPDRDGVGAAGRAAHRRGWTADLRAAGPRRLSRGARGAGQRRAARRGFGRAGADRPGRGGFARHHRHRQRPRLPFPGPLLAWRRWPRPTSGRGTCWSGSPRSRARWPWSRAPAGARLDIAIPRCRGGEA